MNTFSAYVFRQVMMPLLAVLGALAAIALLTQGLNQLDLIVANRRAGLAFAWVTLLAMPQLISLILPLAVFFAVLYALNRMHRESEIVVLYGAGISRRRIATPIIQLAFLAAFVHLGINVLIQPASYRERRETIYELRTDVASSLIREGSFTFPADDLTLYARERGAGGEMRDLMIDDARGDHPLTYTARAGAITMIDDKPALVLRDGQAQRMLADGTVEVLDFDRYVLQLGNFFGGDEEFILKPSDRFLYELFFPDLTAQYDQRNVDKFLAEGHSRLASPLISLAMALIGAAGVLVGEFSRRGYARRMIIASVLALLLRLITLAVQSACSDEPSLNALQYAVPLTAALIAFGLLGGKKPKGKLKRAIQQANLEAASAGRA